MFFNKLSRTQAPLNEIRKFILLQRQGTNTIIVKIYQSKKTPTWFQILLPL